LCAPLVIAILMFTCDPDSGTIVIMIIMIVKGIDDEYSSSGNDRYFNRDRSALPIRCDEQRRASTNEPNGLMDGTPFYS